MACGVLTNLCTAYYGKSSFGCDFDYKKVLLSVYIGSCFQFLDSERQKLKKKTLVSYLYNLFYFVLTAVLLHRVTLGPY